MKKLMRKILVLLVLMALLINSSLLMIISTALDSIDDAIDESKINSILEISLEKYVNYNLGEQAKGTLVQMNVKTGIEYAEGEEYKPLRYTETLLQAPKIEGEYPEKVEFIAKGTKATNGDDNAKDIGYEYNSQDGTLRVGVENKEDEQGNIYSENVNGARDEFVVLYYYGANCYSDENVKRELEFNGKITQIINNEDKSKIEKDYSNSQEVTENVGGLISTNVITSDIYNGYINSNIENGTNLDTEYTENTQLNISYKEVSDEILINQNTKFINTDDKEIQIEDVVYKGVKVNKQKIIDVLGEDFKIYILNDAGATIAELNKDTQADESNIIDLNYDKEYTNVNFKISKPVKEGYLQIESKKAIKSTMRTLENNRIKLTQDIICQNNIQEKNEETGEVENEYTKQIYTYNVESVAEIQSSESNIELHSDKSQLTNSTKNDVVLTAVLKTNDAKYNLFKNPVIEIEMPSEVDNVILGDVSLLYDSNLNIKNYEVQDRSGIKVIRIEIEGTQVSYSNSVISEGANIIIPATIIVNKDIYTTQSSIKMRYSNETGIINSYAKQGKDCEELQINIDSINVPAYSIENDEGLSSNVMAMAYTSSNVSLEGLKIETTAQVGDTTLKDGDTVYEKEVINYIINVTNTTENEMNNVNVKATVPDGTTYITKDGSWAVQGSADTVGTRNDLEVKYEDKKDVAIDLEKIEAGSNYILKYSVIINDLNDEEQKNIENKIYINDTETENKVNLVAKKGKMKINLYPADKEYGKYKNMYIFEAVVYNTSNEKMTNVQLESTLATEMELNYIAGFQNEYDSTTKKLKINVGDIEANSSETVAIRLNAINFKEGVSEYTIPFDLNVFADNTDKYRADTQYVKAYAADISVKMESPTEGKELEIGEEVEYNITIKNTGAVNEYITVIDELSEYVTPIRAQYNKFEYDSEGKEIIQKEEEISLTKKVEIEGEKSYDFKLETVIPKGETINITIIGESDIVEKKTEVSNNVTVYSNETGTKVSNGIVYTILPFEKNEQYDDGDTPPVDDKDLYGKGDLDDFDPSEDRPDNPNNPDDPDNPTDPDDPDNPSKPDDKDNKTYSISGKAWLDSNKDGIKDSDEELLKGITVKLFNSDTNAIVEDEDGNTKKTSTNDSGEYKFEKIAKGNYLVIFEYDVNTYTTTKYQSSGATNSTNSDAIAKEVAIDGQNKTVGVTDILNINSSDIKNIDIGLIKSQIFDLKLDKYVSKIIVNNSDGKKEYSYKNSKLAKVEIASKKLANSTVEIEYKIIVTNEGEIDAQVNEIIDYLPEALNFNSSLNKDWYKAYDGSLRNSSLTGEQIKPGESRELTLILTKTLTQSSIGKIENIAEIGKVADTNVVNDKDSTPGNKKDGEDDYSKAEVIISIKTGIVEGIIIVFIVLGILIVLAYILKNRKINKQLKTFVMLMLILFVGGYSFITKAEESNDVLVEGFKKIVNIKYKCNNGTNSHDNGVWIEKKDINGDGILDTWTSNFEQEMHNEEGTLSPGFICISPGKHLCSQEDHHYECIGVSIYSDYDRFKEDMENDGYYSNGEWIDLSGVDDTFFSKNSGNNVAKLKRLNKNKDITATTGTNQQTIWGPFCYNLSEEANFIGVGVLDGGNNTLQFTFYSEKDGKPDKSMNQDEMKGYCKTKGEHKFYISTQESPDSIKVQVSSSDVKVGIEKGIKVAVYNPQGLCKLGNPQTFIRLLTYKKENSSEITDSIEWAFSTHTGNLHIIKIDESGNTKIPNIKFEITYNKYEQDEKVWKRWTDEYGEINLKNIKPGKYTVEEIASENRNYPFDVQSDTIEEINVKQSTELKRKNKQGYSVQIYKVDENKNKIEDVKFNVEMKKNEKEEYEQLKTLETDEDGTAWSSLKIPVNNQKLQTKIFKVTEIKTKGEYYFNDEDKPFIKIKYVAEREKNNKNTVKWFVMDGDEEKQIDSEKYIYIYNNGTKIGVKLKYNKIIVTFVNEKTATIKLKKVDADNNKAINGVKFKIYFKFNKKPYYIKEYKYESGKAKIKWTTNEKYAQEFITGNEYGNDKKNGYIILKGVPKKCYFSKETSTSKGYKLSEEEYILKEYNKKYIATITAKNEPMRTIGIQKVDNENKNIKINGVKFIIYKQENGSYKYLTSYKYDNDTGKYDIKWGKEENKAIEFETGKNYLDGNTYFVNGEGVTSYEDNNKTHKLSTKDYDGEKGEIILKGMESKTYFAKEIDTGNLYYKGDSKKTYRTKSRCKGKNINWLIDMNNSDEIIPVYTITFEKNEGKNGTDKIYLKGEKLYSDENCTKETTSITVPTKEGCEFQGYKFNGQETEYAFNSSGKLVEGASFAKAIKNGWYSSDMTLYAIWEDSNSSDNNEIYTIKFDQKGGQNGTDKIYLKGGKLYLDKQCKQEMTKIEVPKKEGNTFKGYKFNAQEIEYSFDSNGELVKNGSLAEGINNDMYISDMKLYAIWENGETHTITFEKNGGKGDINQIYLKNKKLYSDEKCEIEIKEGIEVPTKEGYEFQGYKFNGQETEYAFDNKGKLVEGGSFAEGIKNDWYSSDMKLYAIWEECVITNQQEYVDISGYVWNDGNAGKTTERNDKYDKGEERLSGVLVKLVNTRTNRQVGTTERTDNEGKYKFEKVSVKELEYYRIEFSYNGLIYQCVTKETEREFTQDNTSKAEETEANRDRFNKEYAIVEKDRARSGKYLNGNESYHNLTYTHNPTEHTSTFNWKINEDIITSKTDMYEDGQYGSYLNRRYIVSKIHDGKETYEINNVNLGLYVREQPDMALIKDIEDVKLTINGKEYTYNYAQRFNKQNEYGDGFNIKVKFGDKYANMTYKREIYKSDYLWESSQQDKRLTAYITYRIQIRNESSSLKTKINSLVDYYSNIYEINGIGTKNENGEIQYRKVKDNEIDKSYNSTNNYTKIIIDTEEHIGKIESGQSKDIYVQFKLSRDNILKILSDEENKLLRNIVEINSYSIFDKDDKVYAGIDRDSQPGNTIPGDITTYEDDTDSAPGFGIVEGENRTVSGTVFLDSTDDGLLTGKIREGDGIFNTSEKGVKGVKVTLKETSENSKIEEKTCNTDSEGNFMLESFIPGDYILEYEWGGQGYTDSNGSKQKITVQDYKGTIYDKNRQSDTHWYEGQGLNGSSIRYSDAIDNLETRKDIDEKLKDIQQKLDESEVHNTNLTDDTQMVSTTPAMEFGIELKEIADGSYNINNVDFGIVRRAIQSIELVKRIASIKVTLANGNVIADMKIDKDGKPEGNMNYITYIPPENPAIQGLAKIEIDSELIQGAKVEIAYKFEVKNNSEIDINNENYYKYGSTVFPTNKVNDNEYEFTGRDNNKHYADIEDIITISPDIIVDYLDKDLPQISDENNDWKELTEQEIKKKNIEDAVYGDYEEIKNKQIYKTKALSNEQILPGKSSDIVSLKISKLLTTTKDIQFNNEAEIIKLSKTGGSTITRITPGNYKPENKHCESDDSQAENVVILPNTGENLNFIVPITIGISAFIILGIGVFLIKRKVLSNTK